MGSRGQSSGAGKLTAGEKSAIEEYVSGDFMWINQYLRGRGDFGDLSDAEKESLKNLDKATNRDLPEITLYRSVDAEAIFGSMSDGDYEDLTSLLVYGNSAFGKGTYAENMVKRLNGLVNKTEGKTIPEKGFMSTTRDYNVAREWGDFTGSNRPVTVEIKTKRGTKGLDVSYTDKNANGEAQKEVLLGRNQKIKVNKISSRDGQIYVSVQVV